jgi:hypothetical protein
MNPNHPSPDRDAAPPELAGAIARLRIDLAGEHAPPAVWNKVRAAAAVPAAPTPKAPTPLRPVLAWPTVAVGAAVLLGLLLVWWVGPGRSSSPRAPTPTTEIGAGPVGRVPRASGFVPVASPERFAELWQGGAQAAPAWVVRTEVPRERLAALGLPYDPARAGEPVHAELLMHPSGDVLAVRLTR